MANLETQLTQSSDPREIDRIYSKFDKKYGILFGLYGNYETRQSLAKTFREKNVPKGTKVWWEIQPYLDQVPYKIGEETLQKKGPTPMEAE
jgi:hypothetical protein